MAARSSIWRLKTSHTSKKSFRGIYIVSKEKRRRRGWRQIKAKRLVSCASQSLFFGPESTRAQTKTNSSRSPTSRLNKLCVVVVTGASDGETLLACSSHHSSDCLLLLDQAIPVGSQQQQQRDESLTLDIANIEQQFYGLHVFTTLPPWLMAARIFPFFFLQTRSTQFSSPLILFISSFQQLGLKPDPPLTPPHLQASFARVRFQSLFSARRFRFIESRSHVPSKATGSMCPKSPNKADLYIHFYSAASPS